jgi:secreted trypsin-like serine protease
MGTDEGKVAGSVGAPPGGRIEKEGDMRRSIVLSCAILVILALGTGPASAITFGRFDGNRHPNVGALVAEWQKPGRKDLFCSGSVISPTVFLTAAHCIASLASIGIKPHQVWVTFDPTFDENSPLIRGTYHADPKYASGGENDTFDIAVIVLDHAVQRTPVELPEKGLLNDLMASGKLRDATFTAVGYGTVRNSITGGYDGIKDNTERRFATQSFLALEPAWLQLSMNPETGSGGTCYGDSGGPHFLGGPTSNLQVSLTVTGDAVCKATDTTYRLDTRSARQFLGNYVSLP